jgi:hypothetical protein
MRSSSIFLPRLLALGSCLGIALCAIAADAPAVSAAISPDDIVLDLPQAEWSQAWLQWVAAFPRDSSPIADTSGASCAVRQQGDVWFLATSDGTAPVTRACAIPAGKTLFVPIVSTMERSGNKEPDCDSMSRIAGEHLSQHVTRLSMTVDGLAVDNLESYRQASRGCFALGLRQTPRLSAATAVADGYYVMLKPLPAGLHTIAVGARFDSTSLSTTYRLEIR